MTMPASKSNRAVAVGALVGVLAYPAAYAADQPTQDQVTIQAERPTEKVVGRSDLGAPIVLIELRSRVSYADLDLSTSDGAANLKRRVHDAAGMVCRDLDKMYPLSETDRTCPRKAEDGAREQVDAAIAAAKSKTMDTRQ